jgi:hypothetical protein
MKQVIETLRGWEGLPGRKGVRGEEEEEKECGITTSHDILNGAGLS